MSLEDLIDNIGTQNFAKANGVFDDLMKSKMSDALDAEQVRLANTVFNGDDPDEDEDEDGEWEDGDISDDDEEEDEDE